VAECAHARVSECGAYPHWAGRLSALASASALGVYSHWASHQQLNIAEDVRVARDSWYYSRPTTLLPGGQGGQGSGEVEAADKKAAAETEAHQQPNIVEDVRVVKASTLTAGLAERPRSSAARAARARIALPIETLVGARERGEKEEVRDIKSG